MVRLWDEGSEVRVYETSRMESFVSACYRSYGHSIVAEQLLLQASIARYGEEGVREEMEESARNNAARIIAGEY